MPLASGTKLGPYEITSPLGAGGMGEVYRARDSRLGRDVAIKIQPLHLSANAEARQRFEREAKTISALNHPNICTLYDIGHQDGVDFIVMEYVEGESLEQRIARCPLPLTDVLLIGAQISDGLAKAHRSGIIHRDLKPGNIMLAKSGAKLLDFGLAKPSAPLATLATRSGANPISPLTQQGTIVGTFQYMSPEQVEGQPLDARSDIFSLGSVLYEMLTGRKAFEGKSQLSVASAILEKEPEPISALLPLTPATVDHAVRRCLAKNPDERWQTALDLAGELKWIRESGTQTSIPAIAAQKKSAAAWRTFLPWILCGVLAGLLSLAILRHDAKVSAPPAYFSALLPFPAVDLAIAPNGHTVAVVGFSEADRTNAIWLYEIGGQQTTRVAQTEGARFPFWSPDGKSLAFFADGKLKRLDISGGPVQIVCDAPTGRGGTWNKDGVIVFTPTGGLLEGLYRVPAIGGTPELITRPDVKRGEESNRWAMFLPDGKHYLYFAGALSGDLSNNGIFVGALDSKEKKFIIKAMGNTAYSDPGYLFFYRDGTLFAQHFDPAKLEVTGEAVPLLTDVLFMPRIGLSVFSASPSAVLVQRGTDVVLSRLVWYDRKGNEVGTIAKPADYTNVDLSPAGKMLALDKTDEESRNTDVWTYDLEHSTFKRLTFDPAIDAAPVFSPDGQRVLFGSSRQHAFKLFVKNADGAEEEKLVPIDPPDNADLYPCDWSRDGKYVLFKRTTDLWLAELPDWKTRQLVQVRGIARDGQFSPDGKWVAYASNESGKYEVYVTSFPGGRGRWQVSSAGGMQPRWRGDSKELYYLAADGKLMAVPVSGGANFDAGSPVALFAANARAGVATSEIAQYAVTGDGQRFLVNTTLKDQKTQPVTVILNWPAQLEK
jgi:Tol biopolymer transport system component